MKALRCALYARTSTKPKRDPHNEDRVVGQDPELQLPELREYAVQRGFHVVGEFVDVGFSGSKSTRPQLDALMQLALRRKIDVVLVWKLDRWGRSVSHLVNSVKQLNDVGVAFIALRDSLDFTTPAGRLQFHVLAAVAEFEREIIRERVIASLHNPTKPGHSHKGTKLGRKPVPDSQASRQTLWRRRKQERRPISD